MSSPATTVGQDHERSAADLTMRRLLRVPDELPNKVRDEDVHRLFSGSILVSALRCLLSYVVFPVLAPTIGAAGGVGPAVGIPIALVALYFDAKGIRRFWMADHRYRWPISGIYLAVMILVLVLLAENIAQLS